MMRGDGPFHQQERANDRRTAHRRTRQCFGRHLLSGSLRQYGQVECGHYRGRAKRHRRPAAVRPHAEGTWRRRLSLRLSLTLPSARGRPLAASFAYGNGATDRKRALPSSERLRDAIACDRLSVSNDRESRRRRGKLMIRTVSRIVAVAIVVVAAQFAPVGAADIKVFSTI